MLFRKKWSLGKVQLHLPPLPPVYRGVSGAAFQTFTFEERVGEETCLVLLDDPQFSRKLGALKPFNLVAVTGAANTSQGVIGYIVWSVSSRRGHVVDYEHTLNPFEPKTIDLLDRVADQAFVKVLIIDSTGGEVVGFYEFKNNFRLGDFSSGLSMIASQRPAADFALTQTAMRAEFSLEDLKNGLT